MSLTRRLRSVAHNASVTAVRGAADRLGFDTVWRDYYSPIPDRPHLGASGGGQTSELPGVTFDLDAQLTWLEELVPYLEEFRPPRLARSPQEYGWDNDAFGVVDA